MEELVLGRYVATSSTSTREVTTDIGVCHDTVWRISLHSLQLFHVQSFQSFKIDDYPDYLDFDRQILR